jgi:hypothetical protein
MKLSESRFALLILLSLAVMECRPQEGQSDAVYLSLVKEYRLNQDGSNDYRCKKQLKLLTYNAFQRFYGETFIVYNPEYQHLTIQESYTVMADGSRVVTPENAFNEVLPRFAAQAPAYNQLREMVVAHTGLERQAVINLDYSISSDPSFSPYLMGNDVLTTSAPISHMTFIIRIPVDRELIYKVFNLRASPVITSEGDEKVYTWNLTGLHALTGDPHQPEDQVDQPRIIFSTAPVFDDAIRYLVDQEAFNYRLDGDMRAFVNKITEQKTGDITTILTLQDVVVNELNTYDIPPEYTGYRVRSAIETWHSNGGTPLEKAVLLTGLLVSAGINAFPVAVIPSSLFDSEVGCLPLITRFVVQVNPREESQLYLSPVHLDDQSLIYALAEESLVVLNPADKKYRIFKGEYGTNRLDAHWTLHFTGDDKLTGGVSVALQDACNPYLALIRDPNFSSGLLSPDFTRSEITVLQTKGIAAIHSDFHFTVTKESPLKQYNDYYFWDLPDIRQGLESWNITFLNDDRTVPYEIPFPVEETCHYSILLPDNLISVIPDTLIAINNDAGNVMISIKSAKHKMDIERSLSLPFKVFSPAQYQSFRLLINTWNNRNFNRLIFKK